MWKLRFKSLSRYCMQDHVLMARDSFLYACNNRHTVSNWAHWWLCCTVCITVHVYKCVKYNQSRNGAGLLVAIVTANKHSREDFWEAVEEPQQVFLLPPLPRWQKKPRWVTQWRCKQPYLIELGSVDGLWSCWECNWPNTNWFHLENTFCGHHVLIENAHLHIWPNAPVYQGEQ